MKKTKPNESEISCAIMLNDALSTQVAVALYEWGFTRHTIRNALHLVEQEIKRGKHNPEEI